MAGMIAPFFSSFAISASDMLRTLTLRSPRNAGTARMPQFASGKAPTPPRNTRDTAVHVVDFPHGAPPFRPFGLDEVPLRELDAVCG
jgi:hypothetical protein